MTKFCISFFLLVVVFLASGQEKFSGQPDLPGDILFDIGFNTWSQQNDTLKNWGSRSLGVYYNKRFRISNKLSFYGAAGLGFEKFSYQKNYYLKSVSGNISIDTLGTRTSINKNKLAVTYLDLPLELRFHPTGTQEGEGFFISAGLIPGLKLSGHTKLKYEVFKGGNQKQKLGADFGLNDYRVGLQFRVGWKGVNFFYKTYLTKLYRNGQNLIDPDFDLTGKRFNPKISTFGINFSGF